MHTRPCRSKDTNVLLDVFQVALCHLSEFIDRLRLAALDGVKQRKTLARLEIAGRLKASESNTFLPFDMMTGLIALKTCLRRFRLSVKVQL